MRYVSIADVISGLVENKERVGKCDNINRSSKYDKMIFSKYPRKESLDAKNKDTKDRTYKRTYNNSGFNNNADGTKEVRFSTNKSTYYDVLRNED